MINKIQKPWGYEEILESNEYYTVKRIFLEDGKCCSLQIHKEKHETIYILSGIMKLIYGDNIQEFILNQNDYYVIENGRVHRMCGITKCTYLETSTSQLDDTIRLEDFYGRV